ncbi:MAG: hypothetical protein IKL84_03460, partial [Clostridia bacterium]|nr:hypothetical protein [Clostridia bacterium]
MIRKHTKIALFTMAVLMVLAAAFIAVSAATADQMTVSVSGVTLADVGKNYPISVDLFNNANNDINGVEIELRWDPACLKLSGDPKIGTGIPSSAVSQFSANTAKDGVLT